MKLLVLTQYFPPEVGAPQNRLFEMAVRLQRSGVDVTILTAMPNYPAMEIHADYKGKRYSFEELEGLKVHRSSIYVSHSKSIVKRLMNYFSFVWSSYWMGRSKLETNYDYIFCESPPLFLGISALGLCWNKKAKLIFNVSDLWPESAEKLGLVKNRFFLFIATLLEEYLYKKSILITGQTQGIVKNIKGRFPQKEVYWLPNGVDLSYYNPDKVREGWRAQNGFLPDDLLFLYAGILGHAQGLEVILYAAEKLKSNPYLKFILLGSGPEKEKLKQLKTQLKLENVYFFNVVAKNKMPEIVKAIDVALVPLKRLELFKGAIPSKIFENLAMKKALLLGVEGEAKELFIDEGKAGISFIPEDVEDLCSAVCKIVADPDLIPTFGENGQSYVKRKFDRDKIANEFLEVLKKID